MHLFMRLDFHNVNKNLWLRGEAHHTQCCTIVFTGLKCQWTDVSHTNRLSLSLSLHRLNHSRDRRSPKDTNSLRERGGTRRHLFRELFLLPSQRTPLIRYTLSHRPVTGSFAFWTPRLPPCPALPIPSLGVEPKHLCVWILHLLLLSIDAIIILPPPPNLPISSWIT